MEESLSLAICAITALHLKYDKFFPAQSSQWVQKAEDTILQNLEHPSIFKLQAFLLIIRYIIEVGQFSRAFVLAALVSRSAFALRLNYEHPNLCFLAQEIRRRLMWSFFIVDGHFSVYILLHSCRIVPKRFLQALSRQLQHSIRWHGLLMVYPDSIWSPTDIYDWPCRHDSAHVDSGFPGIRPGFVR
jgi:hypothetical protein